MREKRQTIGTATDLGTLIWELGTSFLRPLILNHSQSRLIKVNKTYPPVLVGRVAPRAPFPRLSTPTLPSDFFTLFCAILRYFTPKIFLAKEV